MPSRLFVALVALIALVAAACGGSDDGDEASATSSAETATEDGSGDAAAAAAAEDGAAENGAAENGASAVPDESFDYGTVDYATEPSESALLGNRLHESFPPPVVDPTLIRSGGVPPDGIFPIDEPTFAPPDEIDYELADGEGVIAVEIDGDARAFPVQLMIWHEIVNTEIGGTPVTVTYCPLCNSALTYDRRFAGRVLDFGTSGELYQSALVMYDRQTESLWAHFTGTGLVGHFAGAELELIPTQTVSYGEWKAAHPDGQVLTRALNAPSRYQELYGSNPYAGYDVEAIDPFGAFFVGEIDRTLLAKARIVGIADETGPIAVRFDDLVDNPVIPVTEAGRNLVVLFRPGLASALDSAIIENGREVGQSGVFVPVASDGTTLTFAADGDGFVDAETGSTWNVLGQATGGPLAGEQLQPVVHTDTFWFAWATYQPGTEIIQP
ncbi:MAG: DUF3179 domain-containing protein [Acidimicrobiia bacterium]|nr:DUF3179 domain-containing protein [Acidimicrobiia bacterium]